MPNELEDSGQVRLSPTGAQRDANEGKGRYDLISPIAIARLARINQLGAEKRGDRNWEKGMNMQWFVDSAMRHLFEYLEGMTNEDHLAQCFWNIMCAMHTEEMIARGLLPAELMDLPNYLPATVQVSRIPGPTTPKAKVAFDVLKNMREQIHAMYPEIRNATINYDGEEKPTQAFTVAKPLRFYVGGPYSDDDPKVRVLNTTRALAICTRIARRGHFVLSPHAATGYLDGVMPYEYFMAMDFSQIIAWSNAYFHIADSPGANRERELSHKKGNPIFTHMDQVPFVEPNNYVPLNEQPNDARSSFYQQPQEGGRDGNAPVGQADQASRGDQTLRSPDGHPTEASCRLAEESR